MDGDGEFSSFVPQGGDDGSGDGPMRHEIMPDVEERVMVMGIGGSPFTTIVFSRFAPYRPSEDGSILAVSMVRNLEPTTLAFLTRSLVMHMAERMPANTCEELARMLMDRAHRSQRALEPEPEPKPRRTGQPPHTEGSPPWN